MPAIREQFVVSWHSLGVRQICRQTDIRIEGVACTQGTAIGCKLASLAGPKRVVVGLSPADATEVCSLRPPAVSFTFPNTASS